MALTTVALTPATWDAFAALGAAHNGVWGGCWCIGFHTRDFAAPEVNRARKQEMVNQGTTHAALVMDGDACLGWAQFGSPAELPHIKNRKAYEAARGPLADWRITCFFVSKDARRRGVADAALAGALDLIAASGGGTVEGFPEETEGRKVAGSFLWNGTTAMFDRQGFARLRQIGKHKWVVRKEVAPR